MVSPGAEQLRHRGVRGQQEGRNELRAGQEQSPQDAVGLQQASHRKRQELDHRPIHCLLK